MDSEEEEAAAAAAAAARQRLLAAFVVLAEAAAARPGPKGKCRKKGHFKWEEHVQKLTEDEFKARYRLGSDSFYTLLDRLEPHLSPASKFHALQAARGNSGHPVEPAVKLAVCLRFLAGGQVLDLKLIYNLLAKSTVYAYVWEVVDAINKELVIEFPIDDRSKLDILEKEFRARSRNQVWAGQVGAISLAMPCALSV